MNTRRSFLRRALGSVLAAVAAVYCPGLGADDGEWTSEWVDCREFTSVEFCSISVHDVVRMGGTLARHYRPTVTIEEFLDTQTSGPFSPAPSAENDR